MEEIEIKSAKIKGSFCNYSYELPVEGGTSDSIQRKGSTVIHDDLRKLFLKLSVHMALVTEDLDARTIKNIDPLENLDTSQEFVEGTLQYKINTYRVDGFHISGTNDHEGVILYGSKQLSNGDFVNLQTPRIEWDGDYLFINELHVIIGDLQYEVGEYMNGKAAPKMEQMTMFDEEEKETVNQFEHEEDI